MQEGRWTTITPAQFGREREALDHVRLLLPDTEPYRAWSNFTFTADTGHVYEVDLLVATPSGLHLIEVKSLSGRLTSVGVNWMLTNQSTRTFDNPLHLADLKAKRLRALLTTQARKRRFEGRVPFIQAAVFLSVPSLRIDLNDHQRRGLYGPERVTDRAHALPGIWSDLLGRPPQGERDRLTAIVSKALPNLLADVGIARSRRYYQVGSWQLDTEPFDAGPTWQDHLAHHSQLAHEHRRVRIYLVERNSAKAERASIERAARREMLALHGIHHPGIVQVDAMEPHEGGPALIFRHDRRAIRLDHFVAQYGDRLDAGVRISLIRQLADAIAYAHGRRLYHRGLSARSVLVTPGRARRGEAEEAGWWRPVLQISDWHAATRGPDSAGTAAGVGNAGTAPIPPSALSVAHLERAAEPYLAPELNAPEPDPVALDVFGLGALSYLLLSGQPPAAKRAELLSRLSDEDGLRPSSSTDSVSPFMDELVQAATVPVPARRLSSVAEFLEMLEAVEEDVTAPSLSTQEQVGVTDLLEAKVGDVAADWKIVKHLGTGSTSRAFLAENQRTGVLEVLKVALSDEKAVRLVHEARVLRGVHKDSRIIRLAREDPIEIKPRTMIVLEHAGEKTVARKLREDGRLTADELETYADYLFGAVDHLQGEGVVHRDIKPDNIAIRVRPNRTRQLVLFDFSLAAVSLEDVEAGTPRYLDPFLGTAGRLVYDDYAERYAVAVTLHEMASGELPVWGDGGTEARYTDGPPVLAVEAFDLAIRDELVLFFTKALDRDVARRHGSLKDMRDAWQMVFHRSDRTPPVNTLHPDDDADATPADRDAAAAKATIDTLLEASGLTPRAVSAAHRLDALSVGDLLKLGSKALFTLPGLGAKTRQELQRRVRDWRGRLDQREPSPLAATERANAEAEVAAAEAVPHGEAEQRTALSSVGLDSITARLVPTLQRRGGNRTEAEAVRLLLGLPDEAGRTADLPPWPRQPVVAAALGVTPGRVAQILVAQRKRWQADPVVESVRAELIGLLADSGRVMGVGEMAAAVLSSRGSARSGEELRRAMAMAAVRAAVEIDTISEEPRLLTRRHGDRLMVALEVSADDPPDTPAAPALLDHVYSLGAVADRLAKLEILPSSATVLRELATTVSRGADMGISLGDRRTVRLAAAASETAAASPRLEIYPRDLDPVRALRLAQAGVVPAPIGSADPVGLSPEQVSDRVRARFPELVALPGPVLLRDLLTEAGFDLVWRDGRFFPRPGAGSSTQLASIRRLSTAGNPVQRIDISPDHAAAARAEQRLRAAAGSFRALTIRTSLYGLAGDDLVRRFGARQVSVAERFIAHLRTLVDARPKPTWQTVLAADAADPNSRDALKLTEFTARAWQQVGSELLSTLDRRAPVLLVDAAPLARYDAMELVERIAEAARGGAGAVWLLCPMDDPGQVPRLDDTVVAVPEYEWIALPDAWAENLHRGATGRS